jgi:hypothetical protein
VQVARLHETGRKALERQRQLRQRLGDFAIQLDADENPRQPFVVHAKIPTPKLRPRSV